MKKKLEIMALSDKILALFKSADKPMQLNEISKSLSLKADSPEYFQLRKALTELCDMEVLEKSSRRRYWIKEHYPKSEMIGILAINKEKGLVITDVPHFPKIVVRHKHLNTALDGDTVKVKLFELQDRKKPRGEVIDIIKRNNLAIIGSIEEDGEFVFIIPDEEKHYVDFLVQPDKLHGAAHGDKVSAKLLFWDDPLKSPEAEVIRIIGKAGNAEEQFDAITREFQLVEDFPIEVEKEASDFPIAIPKADIESRLDLRKNVVITIDPEDAKDFDDAVSLEVLPNGNSLLGVHIADVSYYVNPGTRLDKEARQRGTSTYLVDRVVPMLPEKLSNELCSLKEGVVRLTFSVMMEFSPLAVLKNFEIRQSIIKSSKRFSYGEVQKIIDGTLKNKHSDLIQRLNTLAKLLRKKRFVHGGVDFDSSEVKFILDDEKKPIAAELRRTTDATSLIEECMLFANKTVAEYIKTISKQQGLRKTLPFLYRVHDQPVFAKFHDAIEAIRPLIGRIAKVDPSSKNINTFLREFDDSPQKTVVNQILLRSMAKAEYSSKNIGHFGLGFDNYTHFTSPIRRYPDLMVHRLLKEYANHEISKDKIKREEKHLEELGNHCTATERQAMEAERASIKLAQTMLTKNYIGKEFDGTISGVANFGIFVLLDEILAEGFVHIRDLYDDYYSFDEKHLRLIGKVHKKVFHFGGRLRVRVISANVEKRRIDLAYIKQL
jgi:ribonuclease R